MLSICGNRSIAIIFLSVYDFRPIWVLLESPLKLSERMSAALLLPITSTGYLQ